MSSKQTTADALDDISAQILAADAADKEMIVQIGTALEQTYEEVSAQSARAGELIKLCLEALQGIYQESVPDPTAAIDAVVTTVAAIGEHLEQDNDGATDESLQQCQQALRDLLETAGEKSPNLSDEHDQQDEQEAQETEEPPSDPQTPEQPVAADSPPAAEDNFADEPAKLPEDADLELLGEFIVECLDHISSGEAALLELETNPEDTEQINTIFRAFHTIKGTSGFLGLDQIQKVAHLAENLLDRCRDGEIKITGGYADLALKSCDTLKTLIEGLQDVQPGQELDIPPDLGTLLGDLSNPEGAGISEEAAAEQMRLGDILVGQGRTERKAVEKAAKAQGDNRIGETLVKTGAATAADVAKALRTQKKLSGGAAESTIRVGTGRLDSLIEMVGELVIAQSMVAQDPTVVEEVHTDLPRKVSHAGKIVRELQDLSMSLRMVPLKGTFQKMARLVRDLGRKSEKSIQFITEGEDTEIDRSMVEVLNDPLVHMIRNSVDHGVESAQARAEAGKPPTGVVLLRAYHSAGNIVIELSDDGKGLDKEKITAKAVERGLIDSGAKLTDSEAFNLIFRPGFSTAEKVTDVSGRGVGMDVVKKGVEALHGRIDVTSKTGEGSTFSVRVPLTMAITDGMLLRVGKERYLLPTISIEQSFRPTRDSISSVTGRGQMVMLRGNLLPIFKLHELFSVPGAATDPTKSLLVVIEGKGQRCALMVDELLSQQQVVIKSLGKSLGQVPGVAGGAILGDGRVGLILDAASLLELAHRHDGTGLHALREAG